jgi:hypothetical protein
VRILFLHLSGRAFGLKAGTTDGNGDADGGSSAG